MLASPFDRRIAYAPRINTIHSLPAAAVSMFKTLSTGLLALVCAVLVPTMLFGDGRPRDLELSAPDLEAAREADERRVRRGRMPYFAIGQQVAASLWSHGTWKFESSEKVRWTLRVTSPGALSLSLAFEQLRLPPAAELRISAPASGEVLGPLTADRRERLWTPPLQGSELRIQLDVPVKLVDEVVLELSRVNHGYAGFGEREPKSGSCEVDISCDAPPYWRDVGRSVGLMIIDGVRFCSGFMVNNTEMDGRPLFLSALHCGVDQKTAGSVVVIWNHESRGCGDDREIKLRPAFQSGATLRAFHRSTDVVLLELDESPSEEWNVRYAGWDRSLSEPQSGVVIHHPNSDVKRVAFDHDGAIATHYLGTRRSVRGNYLQIEAWELGTTEGGSSGAPLFDQYGRVVGLLRGGFASCGSRDADWFGRLAMAWTAEIDSKQGLGTWLDPSDSGVLTLEALDIPTLPAGELGAGVEQDR